MTSSESFLSRFGSNLQVMYQDINPLYKVEDYDSKMLNTFVNVIGIDGIGASSDEFKSYIIQHRQELKQIVSLNSKSFIFNQPSYLLVFFSLQKWTNRLVEKWPYDYESLKKILIWSGYSMDILYNS